ncbi:extracellular solute-binding protein [Nonomuraea sp. K274]|uniref:Extracellular solute-binding protein n=1 Tax=Nonomuraea cypriaca TaxID=1187855 RepID=A0A931F4K9_9ACTN|nr:extracellular solute-binding protein [Nonomuraea cypriaca]MBF8191048.1 extracellular solute-binding protein [Nonomuraea cypriaca]
MTHLRGMTWDHPRGLSSMQAATAAFLAGREGSGITVEWHARPLKAFEDTPVTELAARYDLLAIDHPFTGQAATTRALLPLEELLPSEVLAEQRANSVGPSFRSYSMDGAQWALPMDAAAQVSAYRPDLLPGAPPRTLEEALDLLRHLPDGVSAQLPANPTHIWSSFLSLCQHRATDGSGADGRNGGRPAWWPESGIEPDVAAGGLALLRELLSLVDPVSFDRNPIQTLDGMAAGEPVGYVPLVFGYSNYARSGFGRHLVRFADAPVRNGTMLGGVGLAISARCAGTPAATAAAELATWVVSRPCQTGIFATAGGQPGHRAAWTDPELNRLTHGFFADTLGTLDRAFLRDRTPGYPRFQQQAGELLHRMVTRGESDHAVVTALGKLWQGVIEP